MQQHTTHKNASGFTLLEMLIAIAIIGILAVVAIPKYNQYKIRGYDAHSKQALRDMHMLCKAYWLESSPLQECRLPIIKKAAYGFNQNPEVMANLPSPTADNFCASAKHNESPNTYSIDRASEINAGEKCAGSVSNESVSEEPVQIASVPEPALLAAVEPSKAEQAAAEQAEAALPWVEARAKHLQKCEEIVIEYQNIQNHLFDACYTGGSRSARRCQDMACYTAAQRIYNDNDAGRSICRNNQTPLSNSRGLQKFNEKFNPQCPRYCGSSSLSVFLMNQNRGNKEKQEAIRQADYCTGKNKHQRISDFGVTTIEGTAANGFNTYELATYLVEDEQYLKALAKKLSSIDRMRGRRYTKPVNQKNAAEQASVAIQKFNRAQNRPQRFCRPQGANSAFTEYVC
jgi:prepilin-type N-terminal cleavage/methylation domain-containing protein